MTNLITIARFELVRLFFTMRGWLSLLAFFLVWSVLLRYLVYNASGYLLDETLSQSIGGLTGNSGVQSLLAWPVPEITAFWVMALYLFPLFSLILTADQTASDRSRGTLRLINLRATRDEIFFGRFIGQMIIQSLLILATIATVIVLAIWRDADLLPSSLALSALVSTNLFLVLLPYTALMALVSVIAKSARQATVYATIFWIVLFIFITWLTPLFPQLTFLEWILPGSQLSSLLQKEGWDTLSLAHIPLIQASILLLAGRWLMQRGDL